MLLEDLLPEKNQQDSEEAKAVKDRFEITTLSLHKYVWGLVGISLLFFATFPLAYWRVARSEKFDNRPVNSLTWQQNQKNNLAYPKP